MADICRLKDFHKKHTLTKEEKIEEQIKTLSYKIEILEMAIKLLSPYARGVSANPLLVDVGSSEYKIGEK